MAVKVEVRGQSELRALTRGLKEFGEKDLRREFYKALQKASEPMLARARQEAAKRLPKGGGLASYVDGALKAKTTTATAGGRDPRVRVVFSAENAAAAAFKKTRSKSVRTARRKYKESLMTPEQKAERAARRREASAKAAATRRAKKG